MPRRPPRGGPQQIPQPPGWEPGDDPPWATLSGDERRITVADIRSALAAAGPAEPSPREALVARGSAVLAALYDTPAGPEVILTRRPTTMRVHQGEVSFPGGRIEPGETAEAAARREAFEEIGLAHEAPEIIGELDHLSTVSSDSFIVPFVGVVPERPHVVPNPAEVDVVLFVPLAELLDPDNYHEERWTFDDRSVRIVFFELEGDTVWGATASMLRQLLALATGTGGRGDLAHD